MLELGKTYTAEEYKTTYTHRVPQALEDRYPNTQIHNMPLNNRPFHESRGIGPNKRAGLEISPRDCAILDFGVYVRMWAGGRKVYFSPFKHSMEGGGRPLDSLMDLPEVRTGQPRPGAKRQQLAKVGVRRD
jgi:hypothetical protein